MPLRRQVQGLGRLLFLAVVLLLCIILFYGLANELFEKRLKGTPGTGFGFSLDGETARPVNQYCDNRFGVDYLKSFRNSHAQYCSNSPEKLTTQSRMTCLSNNVDPSKARTDSFCIAGPAMYNNGARKFDFNCQLKTLTTGETVRGAQPLSRFPAYWYQTGPKHLLDHYFNLNVEDPFAKDPFPEDGATLILVKREAANFNMWHSLMEIMSAYWSLLVLSQTMDVDTGRPLYSHSESTQILIMDDIADGPYFDMWSLITPSPPRRRPDPVTPSSDHSVPIKKLVVPLPGGSNPFWQGDWGDLNCTSSRLLDDFSQNALARYDIKPDIKYGAPITITYIDRLTKRRLIDQDNYIAALRKAHPYVTVDILDYASYKFEEQLKISATTDILVGVHGAGLTHAIFMPRGSAIVEFMPFNLDYRGFKNIAKMRGIGYYQAKTEDKRELTHAKGDWQDDDVWMSEEAFLFTVGEAIEDLHNERNQG